jgi:hypothetical protein
MTKTTTEVVMDQDRETKNKVRYKAESEAVDTLYLGKEAAKKHGKRIKITVEKA